jgi:hypothetical protein
MRIHTRTSWDIETGTLLADEWYEYDGPVAEAKGDTKKQDAQLQLQNQQQQQQLQKQNDQLSQIQGNLAPYLTGNRGFSPEQLSLMNSQALDQNAAQYNQAGNQVRQALLARGESGQTPLSGTGVSGIAGLLSGKASDAANALRTNQLASAQQALTNQFNANSILSGNAQTLAGNVGTFGSGASGALNALTQKQIADQQNSFMSNLSRGLGAGLGAGLGGGVGAGVSGGLGTALSTLGKGNFGW